MHLAAHTWPRSEPLETTARRVAALGYSAVVLTGEPELYDPERAAAVLAAEGLSCWGAASVMAGERNLAAAEPARRAATVGYLQDVVRLVGAAGGPVLTIVPVTVGLLEPAGSARDEWEWLVEGLRAVDEEAARCGVTLALEPINRFETYLLNRAEQALALAEAVGDRCGVCLDTFHLNIEEVDLHAAIRLVGDRLASSPRSATRGRSRWSTCHPWSGLPWGVPGGTARGRTSRPPTSCGCTAAAASPKGSTPRWRRARRRRSCRCCGSPSRSGAAIRSTSARSSGGSGLAWG